jgi:hypothetical protein
VTKICPKCSTENPDYANFCQECGENIHSITIHEYGLKTSCDFLNYSEKNDGNGHKEGSTDFAYVIFLERADGHYEGLMFPQFFKYEYGANTDSLLEKALKNNHLVKSDPLYNVEKAKVNEIKEILKKYDLKVSGRKRELIERIKTNLSEKDIKSNFQGSYYVLTDKGRDIVKKNNHIIYYHKSKYLHVISLEKYHDLLKDSNIDNLKYDIALELLEEYVLEERKQGNWGLYRNSFLAIAKVYEDKKENEIALNYYLKICLLDSSGLNNGNQYLPKLIFLAPGIIDLIDKINYELKFDTDTLKKKYYKCSKELNLPKTELSKEESFKRLINKMIIN